MKKEHAILIVVVIVLLIIFIAVISSIGTKSLTCTATGKSSDMKTNSKLEIKVKNKKIKDMVFTVDMIFPKELLNQRQSYVDMIRQTKPYMRASVTDEGIRFVTTESGGSFIGIDTSQEMTISELKQVLELQGYNCKEAD